MNDMTQIKETETVKTIIPQSKNSKSIEKNTSGKMLFELHTIKEWKLFCEWLQGLGYPKPSPSEPRDNEWKSKLIVSQYRQSLLMAENYNLTVYNKLIDAIRFHRSDDGIIVNFGRLSNFVKHFNPEFEIPANIVNLHREKLNKFIPYCLEQRKKLDEIIDRIGYKPRARR